MKVVLVAPSTPNLFYLNAEVQAIWQSGLDVEPYIGEVRHADVLKAVTTAAYDVFWFSGHATAAGLLLTDGPLSASELTPLIRGRFRLVVLNSCNSRDTARMLQNETEAAVIATVVEVPDRLAFQTGALFARELAKTGNIYSAYHAAKPGQNRIYELLGWDKQNVIEYDTLDKRLDRVESALHETQRTLARVVALMDGDHSYRIVGMPEQLAAYIKSNEEWKEATKQHLLSTESRVSTLESSNSPVMITRATVIFMVAIGTTCLVAAFLLLTWLQSAG